MDADGGLHSEINTVPEKYIGKKIVSTQFAPVNVDKMGLHRWYVV